MYWKYLRKVLISGALITGIGVGGVSVDILTRQWSDSHTLISAVNHYITQTSLQVLGWLAYNNLESDTKNFREVQENFLLHQLQKNKNTIYGEDYNFSASLSREAFVQNHPLTVYSHYKHYVERIMKGEENVMTAEPPVLLAVSHEPSGRTSIFPTTKYIFDVFFVNGIAILYNRILDAFPVLRQLQKNLNFILTPHWNVSEGGTLIGPNFLSPTNSREMLHIYTTPEAVYEISSELETMYIHLLFGLQNRKLGILEADSAYMIYTGFRTLEKKWQILVNDIKTGQVNESLAIPEYIHDKLNAQLKPDPVRAEELQKEFEKGFEDIAKRIWPELNVVLCTDTGAMQFYGDVLKKFYCRSVKHYSPIYGASTGLVGLNIWPKASDTYYLLIPSAMFFEFIHIDSCEKEQPCTLFADQLQVGRTYELVLTNNSGLYRYRQGDVLQVVGFHNHAPVIKFLYRQDQLLNVRGEKTTEKNLYTALHAAASKWKDSSLIDYSFTDSSLAAKETQKHSWNSWWKTPSPYYILFIEVNNRTTLTVEQKLLVDKLLCTINLMYGAFRVKGGIAPLKVLTVKSGTFDELKSFLVQKTPASPCQVKIPRVLKSAEAVSFMMERVQE